MSAARERPGDRLPIPLDPFGFDPEAASGVAGLRGGDRPTDPAYVFHTPYLAAPSSELRFEGRLRGLEARGGTIIVLVHMEVPGGTAPPRVVARLRLDLRHLTRKEGRFAVRCMGLPGAGYAVLARLSRGAAARADALDLALLPEGRSHLAPDPSLFVVEPDDPIAALHSTAPAVFADPVSQMCTAAQFDEPAYLAWRDRLREDRSLHRKQWEFLFILQALGRHGLLRPGMRGLGFGVGHEPLPAAMAAMGVASVATDLQADAADAAIWRDTGQHVDGLDQLRRPDLCDDAVLDRLVRFRPADMRSIPPDLRNFDFTWSSCALEHLGSIEAGLRFVEDSVACLRPGGVAVHTTEFNLSSNDRTLDGAGTVLFRRRDLERLALRLIAAGHDVAPIKLDPGGEPVDRHLDMPPYGDPHLKLALGGYATTSFGIIVRAGGHADPPALSSEAADR
ncbi:SAM-dependent methyltransferase [uncultured Sphingomonas sp.]|uniref:SAM-dependent methyltransferase n=1 Tax=uncultured Sphingomonas sp. TaxID=158754 RepID=UPI0035CA14EA